MDYLKEKFSIAYTSKKYRENWEKVFKNDDKKEESKKDDK